MRKIITLGIMLLFLGMTISSSTGFNLEKQSIKPISSGDTLYVGGSGEGNYTKIQDAIDDAKDGDTVFVFDNSSPYRERLVVDKSINLIGEDRGTTVIESKGIVIKISADWVNISGFTIRNGVGGIYISSNYNTISGNNIQSKWEGGIWLQYSNNNVISGNNISKDDFAGVYLCYSNNNTVSGNNINLSNNCGLGLHESNNNTIFGNDVSNNNFGLCIFWDSNNNTIKSNTITSNNRSGISLDGNSNTVSGNNISNNEFGIGLYSNYNNISNNNIQNNKKFGLAIESSNNNVIESNNFIDNKRSAFFVGTLYNKWEGNYWDKPREYPKPIFGNIGVSLILVFVIGSLIPLPSFVFDILFLLSSFFCTHFPSWVNFDWRPALLPYDIGV